MENQVEFEKLINGLSEDNFNKLVIAYAKEYYETNELHLSNGPYDGGIDLTYFKHQQEIKKNIQITVTKKKIEEKLFEDVAKSAQNVSQYGYLNKLDFFISQTISPVLKKKFIRRAEVDFDISLKIIDAKKLSGNMDEFRSIKNTLKEIYQFDEKDSNFKISKKNKVLFNVIATSEDSSKIKRHLIHAYILSALFEKPNLDLNDLYSLVKDTITVNFDKDYILQEINYLKSRNAIQGSSNFSLSEKWEDKLHSILELNNIQEKDLSLKLNDLLAKNDIKDKADDISRKLIQLYVEHFKYEIEEFESKEGSFTKSTRKIFDEIISMLREYGVTNRSENIALAKDIIEITSSNDFLTKIGASSMYVKLYNSNKLEEFIEISRRSVCLDTQILIRLLCVLYNSNTKDYSLLATERLHKVINDSELMLDVFTVDGYIEEVAAHLQKALKIHHYLKLPVFDKVGKTRNVFYNYYKELLDNENISESSFRDFIENELLGISLPDEFDKDFVEIVINRLIKLFENLDYYVYSTSFYEEFNDVKRSFETYLSYEGIVRSRSAVFNDIKASFMMSDEENHFDSDEGLYSEPYFLTWDYQFYKLREITKEKFKDFNDWFIYTPHKFIEKIQLSKFKVNPDSINENILSILETNYNSDGNKKSFLDVISAIFNKEDVSELKLAQKFANIEEEYINEIESKDSFNIVMNDESPLTSVLSILISHYNGPKTENSMNDLTNLFQNNEKADELVIIIKDSIKQFNTNKLVKNKLIENINNLMST